MGEDGGGLLISPDEVAPIRMVGVSACYLPLHHKVQKISSGTGSPGWPWKKDHRMAVCEVSVAYSHTPYNSTVKTLSRSVWTVS